MSVAGASSGSNAFGRFQSLMKEVQGAVDAREAVGKKQLTAQQADQIVREFEQLKGPEKALASTALQAFLQQDVFEVTGAARQRFATALGVDVDSLKPQATAGGAKTTALKAGLKMIAGTPNLGAKDVAQLFKGIGGLPPGVQAFITSMLGQASKDNEVKMDGEARPQFRKETAARNQTGAIDDLNNRFGEDFTKRVPKFLLDMMSSPPLFEELIFILMITLVSDTQKEVLEEQKRIQKAVDNDAVQSKEKEQKSKEIDAGLIKRAGGANEPQPGSPIDTKAFDAEAHRAGKSKAKFEQVVNAVDQVFAGQAPSDPKGMLAQFEKTFPVGHPAREMVANAIGSAVQHNPAAAQDPVLKDKLKPFLDFAQQATGKTDFDKPISVEPQTKAGEALQEAIRPEQRLAGIIVDAMVDQTATGPKASVEKFKPVLEEMFGPGEVGSSQNADVNSKILARMARLQNAAERLEAKSTAAGKPQRIDVDQGLTKIVEREMPNASPEERKSVTEAVKKAFAQLPKGRPATADDINKAWVSARASLVEDVLKDDPVVAHAEKELVGGAIDKAIEGTNTSIKNHEDTGQIASKDEKRGKLEQCLAAERQRIVDQAHGAGYNEKMTEGLTAAFDRRADQVRAKFEKTAKVEPENNRGIGKESTDPAESNDTRSRQIMFEQLKFKMNMLSEMMQSMSNILNTMHQNAENTIRAIR